jgi:hypothetical protein
MAHDGRARRFLRISYEFLFDSKKIKVKNRTSQNGKGSPYPLITIQGSRIRKAKLVIIIVYHTFQFSSVRNVVTITKIR